MQRLNPELVGFVAEGRADFIPFQFHVAVIGLAPLEAKSGDQAFATRPIALQVPAALAQVNPHVFLTVLGLGVSGIRFLFAKFLMLVMGMRTCGNAIEGLKSTPHQPDAQGR